MRWERARRLEYEWPCRSLWEFGVLFQIRWGATGGFCAGMWHDLINRVTRGAGLRINSRVARVLGKSQGITVLTEGRLIPGLIFLPSSYLPHVKWETQACWGPLHPFCSSCPFPVIAPGSSWLQTGKSGEHDCGGDTDQISAGYWIHPSQAGYWISQPNTSIIPERILASGTKWQNHNSPACWVIHSFF